MAIIADVTMNYACLEEAAGKITAAEGELETLISNLTSVVTALGEGYSGESYNAFLNAWNESKPTMEKLKEAVGNFAPALKTAAENQRQLDQATAQRNGNLGIGF
ncbi:MAG: WXG100 family type VII secretion target [Ruminococcaceae bacterium]|nr:WXG100 family type VII secretion target [Oscillospiraceae bacterium]